MLRHQFDLWGGSAEIWTPARLEDAVTVTRNVVAAIDDACSTHRTDSEVGRVNRHAGEVTAVSPTLWQAVRVALWAAWATDGLTDPTLGTPGTPGRWREVLLDPAEQTVQLPSGTALDLGATAKAWCADLSAQLAHQQTGQPVLVNLLGDVATAGPAPAEGWHILAAEDHRNEDPGDSRGAGIRIESGGVATSSQHGHRGARHLIDPTLGRPSRGEFRTVSVAAATCTEANAAATAAVVRRRGSRDWLERRNLPARLVHRSGDVVLAAGWPT